MRSPSAMKLPIAQALSLPTERVVLSHLGPLRDSHLPDMVQTIALKVMTDDRPGRTADRSPIPLRGALSRRLRRGNARMRRSPASRRGSCCGPDNPTVRPRLWGRQDLPPPGAPAAGQARPGTWGRRRQPGPESASWSCVATAPHGASRGS
jgi:hypothetical protein